MEARKTYKVSGQDLIDLLTELNKVDTKLIDLERSTLQGVLASFQKAKDTFDLIHGVALLASFASSLNVAQEKVRAMYNKTFRFDANPIEEEEEN